jgi:GT2 family glycosyltransferase
LEHQTIQPGQIIVVDSGTDGAADMVAEMFPRVEMIRYQNRKYPGDARNIGVRHAKGGIVAFLDADCIAGSRWTEAILTAHQRPDPIIGGAVDNANPGNLVGWARYFSEFSRWMPFAEGSHMVDVPTCSLSLKPWAFERFGPFLEGTYCSDTVFCWRAADAGYLPLFLPAICVAHINPTGFSAFLAKQTMHGRAFATVRIREKRLSRWHTAMLSLGSPALPFILFGRLTGRVLKSRRNRLALLGASPLILVGLVAWSWGEATRYGASLQIRRRPKDTPKALGRPA